MSAAGGGVGIVLLAAGRGVRFGEAPKLLAPLDGRPLAAHAAAAAAGSGLRPIVTVLGAGAEGVRAALAGLDTAFVENPDFAAGLSTSLRAGLAALPGACRGAVVLLGDMPRVTGAGIAALARAFGDAGCRPAAVVPVAGGRRGNPVLLNHRRLAREIAALTGDHGAGPLLRGRDDVLEIEGDAATLLDVDTPGDLARLAGSGAR